MKALTGLPIAMCLLLLAQIGSAQLVAVTLENASEVRKYRRELTLIDHNSVLVCEPVSGVDCDSSNWWCFSNETYVEFYVLNPKDPHDLPYKIKDGVRQAKRGRIVRINEGKLGDLRLVNKRETLSGLSNELRLRRSELETLIRAAKENEEIRDETTLEFAIRLEELTTWLECNGCWEYLPGLEKELRKQFPSGWKLVKARRKSRESLIRLVEVPKALRESSKRVGFDYREFKVMESQHFRVVFTDSVTEKSVRDSLVTGEKAFESFTEHWFRALPVGRELTGIFHEQWFGPDEPELYEHFLTDYYGLSWGPHKELLLDKQTNREKGSAIVPYLEYEAGSRYGEPRAGLRSNFIHTSTHSLCNLVLSEGGDFLQDWVDEGVCQFLATRFTGRDSTTCVRYDADRYNPDEHKDPPQPVVTGFNTWLSKFALSVDNSL